MKKSGSEKKKHKSIFTPLNVHVPVKTHDKLMKAVTQSKPVSIKLDLLGNPEHKIFVTSGQLKKIKDAVTAGKKEMTLRFSCRQSKYNVKAEGGFLAPILAAAARFLPSILAGILAGSVGHNTEGNGMFLGRKDYTYQIRHSGEGLLFTPAEKSKTRGLYVRHNGRIFQGEGIIFGPNSPFKNIPLLGIIL